jgi:sulfite reductase (NADPH) flavoprotein alpha-component
MIKTNISSIFKMGRKTAPADVTILYGSKSGNARFVAEETARYLHSQNITTDVQNMKRFSPGKLATISNLFIIVSTHGEGDPPQAAAPFYSLLRSPFNTCPTRYVPWAIPTTSFSVRPVRTSNST